MTLVALVWAVLLAAIGSVGFLFGGDTYVLALLGSAASIAVLIAVLLGLWPRGTPRTLALPSLSLPTTIAALGVCAIVTGLVVGAWLVLIGAGVALAGLGGVVRELAGQRSRP